MDDKTRARLFTTMDETMELVEHDTHEGEPGWDDEVWWNKLNELAAREDGSVQAMVRMMSRLTAATAVALSAQAKIPIAEVLRRSRLSLLNDIEHRWS